jgi:hypothetical protein
MGADYGYRSLRHGVWSRGHPTAEATTALPLPLRPAEVLAFVRRFG